MRSELSKAAVCACREMSSFERISYPLPRAICAYLDSEDLRFGDYARSHVSELESIATAMSGSQNIASITKTMGHLHVNVM